MGGYLFKRLLGGIPIILGVTLVTFVLFDVFGGNPVVQFLGKNATAEQIAKLEHAYGFDRPLFVRYCAYLLQIVTFDFGDSFATKEPVTSLLLRRAPASLSLTLPALFTTTILSVSVASIAAYFRGRILDRALMMSAVLGMSISFLVYIVVGQYLLAFEWPLFQIHGYEEGFAERWQWLALPILIIVVVSMGYDARLYRSVMVEETNRDYVTTALSKGVTLRRVLFVHVLKNSMLPIVTHVMLSVPFLVTGSLLLESFFGIPGLGGALLEAIDQADLPVIKAYTVMISVLFVLSNLLTDVCYAVFDPRVRFS
jgi:peptide/nickel transport system permease protein